MVSWQQIVNVGMLDNLLENKVIIMGQFVAELQRQLCKLPGSLVNE